MGTFRKVIVLEREDKQEFWSNLKLLCAHHPNFSYEYIKSRKFPFDYKEWHFRKVEVNKAHEHVNHTPKPSIEAEFVQTVLASVGLLEKLKNIVIFGETVFVTPTILSTDPINASFWKKNIYMYMRLKKNYPNGKPLYFRNIETKDELGVYDDFSL